MSLITAAAVGKLVLAATPIIGAWAFEQVTKRMENASDEEKEQIGLLDALIRAIKGDREEPVTEIEEKK